MGSPKEVATNASLALLANGHLTAGMLSGRVQPCANATERLAGHLAAGTRPDGVQLSAIATMAGAVLDVSMEVAANASLDTGPRAQSLRLLADGHLTAGTASDVVELFMDMAMTRALLDSGIEVADDASVITGSFAFRLQLLANGHLTRPCDPTACGSQRTRFWPVRC